LIVALAFRSGVDEDGHAVGPHGRRPSFHSVARGSVDEIGVRVAYQVGAVLGQSGEGRVMRRGGNANVAYFQQDVGGVGSTVDFGEALVFVSCGIVVMQAERGIPAFWRVAFDEFFPRVLFEL